LGGRPAVDSSANEPDTHAAAIQSACVANTHSLAQLGSGLHADLTLSLAAARRVEKALG
jgi:hypothetical protein